MRFDHLNWASDQTVFVYAPDDTRSEGDRIVVSQHTVISADTAFNGVDVRNVEVTVRDNDTPGILVTEIELGSYNPLTKIGTEDARSLVIEGDNVTQLTDEILLQLATAPELGDVIVVKEVLVDGAKLIAEQKDLKQSNLQDLMDNMSQGSTKPVKFQEPDGFLQGFFKKICHDLPLPDSFSRF